MYFNFTPNITVEYTLTPNSVNLPVLVASAFKIKLKLERSHGSKYRRFFEHGLSQFGEVFHVGW